MPVWTTGPRAGMGRVSSEVPVSSPINRGAEYPAASYRECCFFLKVPSRRVFRLSALDGTLQASVRTARMRSDGSSKGRTIRG